MYDYIHADKHMEEDRCPGGFFPAFRLASCQGTLPLLPAANDLVSLVQ
jgi:hypothetical protein